MQDVDSMNNKTFQWECTGDTLSTQFHSFVIMYFFNIQITSKAVPEYLKFRKVL